MRKYHTSVNGVALSSVIRRATQMIYSASATQRVNVSTLQVHGLEQRMMKCPMESSRICPIQVQVLQAPSFPLATINGRIPNEINVVGPPKRRTCAQLRSARLPLARTRTPKNLGTDHAQLAPNTHSLSSPDEDYHDNEVSRNFILLTPVKIGPQKASLYTNPNSAQQHSPPVCLSANPKPNQTTHGGQLTLSPNSISPKIVNNLSKSYNMNHSDLTPRIHPNQNSLTTSKKNNPRITQLWKTTKLHPPLSKPQATNQKRKVPKLRLIFSQKTEESC